MADPKFAELIINTVADVYELPLETILSPSKKRPLVEARQMMLYIMHKEGFQGKVIARYVKRSTCIVARNKLKIEGELPFYKATREKYNAIIKLINKNGKNNYRNQINPKLTQY